MPTDTLPHIREPLHPIVANSIATAALKLQHYYFDEPDNHEDISEAYQDCLRNLRNLSAEDFFKASTPDKTYDAADADADSFHEMNIFRRVLIYMRQPSPDLQRLNDIIQEIEIKQDLFGVVGCITAQSKTQQSAFDTVTLYHEGQEKQIKLPLKLILPMVFKALQEDAQFAKQYKGSAAQRLAQAQADRPLRMHALYDCLNQVKQRQCHIGIGNALMLLLKHVAYEGVDILDAPKQALELVLQRQLTTLMHDAISKPQPSSPKTEPLKASILAWMLTHDASNLIHCLDAHQALYHAITTHINAHGSHVNALTYQEQHTTLDALILDASQHLPFQHDVRQQPMLVWMDNLLKAYQENVMHPVRQPVLNRVHTWLTTSFSLWDKTDATILAHVYAAHHTYKQLQYNMLLLLSHGVSLDEINQLNQALETYFNAEPFGILSTELYEKIKIFQQDMKQLRHSPLHDFVEGFFARREQAFQAGDVPTQAKLYETLLDRQSQLAVSDDFLTPWLAQWDGNYCDVAYEINMILLHGIITPPHTWSQPFTEAFQKTITKITAVSDEQLTEPSAYPTRLIEQLNYLAAQQHPLSEKLSPARPNPMLLLPAQVTTAMEWFQLAFGLSSQRRNEIYYTHQEQIDALLMAFITDVSCLVTATLQLPVDEIAPFIERLGEEKLASLVQTIPNLFSLLKDLTSEQGILICTMLQKHLRSMPFNLHEFFSAFFLSSIIGEQKVDIFFNAFKERAAGLIQNKTDINYVFLQMRFLPEYTDTIFSFFHEQYPYFLQHFGYEPSSWIQESLSPEIKLFLENSRLLCVAINTLAEHSSTTKANNLMQSLLDNQQGAIQTNYRALFQGIHANNLHAPSTAIKQEQQQRIITCIRTLPAYWLRRLEAAVDLKQKEDVEEQANLSESCQTNQKMGP